MTKALTISSLFSALMFINWPRTILLKQHRLKKLEAFSEACMQRPEFSSISKTFEATMDQWASENIRMGMLFRSPEKTWQPMELFLLNEQGDRALFFMHWEDQKEPKKRFQHYKTFAVEWLAEKGEWRFFSSGVPSFLLEDYTATNGNLYVKKRLIEDGLVGLFGKVRNNYISDRWFMDNRFEKYQKVIQDKYYPEATH